MFGLTILKTCAIATALSVASFAGAASATTVDLTTGGDITGDGHSTGAFSAGDISGTVTAGCGYSGFDTNCDHVGPASNPKIQTTLLGTGVSSFLDVSNQLDTANNGEFLTFTFDSAVTLLGIDFGAFGVADAYDLIVNGTLVASGSSTDPWTTDLYNVTSFTIASVDIGCFDRGFTVKSFEAVAPVPLPAAGLLLTGALGALGMARRRRRQA